MQAQHRQLNELDLECYPAYFLAKFYDELTRQFYSFSMWPGQPLDIMGIINRLANVTVVTFNGIKYDILMLTLALYGATCEQLKEANDDIIVRKMMPWEFCEKWGIQIPDYIDTIDIMEVAPGVRIGLKMYMGRLHAPTLQDLPYDPDTVLDGAGRFVIAEYCGNDLIGTNLLRHEIWERVQLRLAIGERYKIDVRSKSDAQIAEAVIKSQLAFYPEKRYVPHGYSFYYAPPEHIHFITPQMQELLDLVKRAPFIVTDKEEALMMYGDATGIRTGVNIPEVLKGRDIVIGKGVYRMGIGGLHSQETSVSYFSDDNYVIKDIDVKSYYPSLILTMGMVPEQLGPAFQTIFRAIYDRRLASKAEATKLEELGLLSEAKEPKTESDGLKIVLNGTFGKLFSKYSILYAPELGIRVTVTGQLYLLMLIEMMECSGIQVLSANTDGIVLRIPRGLVYIADQIVKWWESSTGLEMEETIYKSIHFRDVNNYIAIDAKGKAKRKGVFNNGGVLSGPQGKGPNMDIAADAVVEWLKTNKPIADTIRECQDIKKFVVLRGVSGGGTYKPALKMGENGVDFDAHNTGTYLGKAVRWYYGLERSAYVADSKGGRVAGSLGAVPVMKLPDTFPQDIDYDKYIAEAMEMVADSGMPVLYWHHAESDCVFVDHANIDYSDAGGGCDLIDKKTYDKRK